MNKFEKIKFVSIGGNNDIGDGSFELPYRTIQYAVSDVPIGELGWRVIAMSGSYDEPNLDLLPNIPLQAMIPNTVTIINPIIFAYNGSYNFNGINFSIIDNYAFTCTNNLNLQLTFTDCKLTATPTVDSGCGIFNVDNAMCNISIIDSLLSIQNYQELVSIINTTININGEILLTNCDLKAIKSNQIQLDAPILLLNGNIKVIVENSKIYGQTQIENNASIIANKTNFKTNQSPIVVTNSSTTSRLTHCNIDCETNPVIDGLGTLQVAECCFLNNGTRFSTTLNNNTGIYYLPTTSPRLVDQALPESIQSGALYYAQGNFYDDRISRFKLPQADQLTGIIPSEQLPDAEYGKKGINYLISVRKGATKQSTVDMEAGNNIEIDNTNGVAIFNAQGELTSKVLVELTDGTTQFISKFKEGDNMDWVINGETVTQSATGGGGESYEIGDGLQTTLNPDTGLRTISTKVNANEFRYNENGVIELSDQVDNSLSKANTSVQTVNQIPADSEGNVNVAGSLPVLVLVSDYVGDLTVLHDWLLAQPNQESKLYFITKTIPNIVLNVPALFARDNWFDYCKYINGDIQNKYDGVPDFKIVYAPNGRLYISTNDILNPIGMYIPLDPTTSLNTQMFLTPPGATIVSQPYATIDQVNTIVNSAVIPLQQDIELLNLDMFFTDYYIGVSINYLLSGKWDGDEITTYNDILSHLDDTNILKFTLASDVAQFNYPLTITKLQFIGFTTLGNFIDYISAQMLEQYEIKNFQIAFKEFDTQGFLISNIDSNKGILVCDDTDNNLAVIMKLTDLTGAKDRAYTNFSDNSLQQQIIDNKLIINDVFINKINNGENVTIDVDSVTNTATFSAIGGSGGANKVTVSVNGANPVAYNVDGSGNIAINVPLTTSLESNSLLITTDSGLNAGKTNLHSNFANQFTVDTNTKQVSLSPAVTSSLAKADTAIQSAIGKGGINVQKNGTQLIIDGTGGGTVENVDYWQYAGSTFSNIPDPSIIPSIKNIVFKSPFPSKKIFIAMEFLDTNPVSNNFRLIMVKTATSKLSTTSPTVATLIGGAFAISDIQTYFAGSPSLAGRTLKLQFGASPYTLAEVVLTSNDANSYQSLADAITTQVKSINGLGAFNCTIKFNQLVMTSNNPNLLITYPYASGYPLQYQLKIYEEFSTINNDIVIANQIETNISGRNTTVLYASTGNLTSIAVDTDFVSFAFDASVITNNKESTNLNKMLIELYSDVQNFVEVGTPNQFYNRLASNHTDSGALISARGNEIMLGGLTYSPQIVCEYNNDEINFDGLPIPIVKCTLNFAKYPFDLDAFNMVLITRYKNVIAPIKPYKLQIIIIVQDPIIGSSKYTVNNGKTTYTLEVNLNSSVSSNGILEVVYNLQCDNNNIVINSYKINNQGVIMVNNTLENSILMGQVNLGSYRKARWEQLKCGANVGQVDGLKFEPLSATFEVEMGKVLKLTINGTFFITNQLVNPASKLYIALINTANTEDFHPEEIPFGNLSNTIQTIENLKLVFNLGFASGTRAYQFIVYADPIDANSRFSVSGALGFSATYDLAVDTPEDIEVVEDGVKLMQDGLSTKNNN
jgi:hypothetical protein